MFDRREQAPADALALARRIDDERMQLPVLGRVGDRPAPADDRARLQREKTAPVRVGEKTRHLGGGFVRVMPGGRNVRERVHENAPRLVPVRGRAFADVDEVHEEGFYTSR